MMEIGNQAILKMGPSVLYDLEGRSLPSQNVQRLQPDHKDTVWPLVREELVRLVALKSKVLDWRGRSLEALTDNELLEASHVFFPRATEQSVQVAGYWMDHYLSLIDREKPHFTVGFSSSGIAARSLKRASGLKEVPCLALESVATGDSAVLQPLQADYFADRWRRYNSPELKRVFKIVHTRFEIPWLNKNVSVKNPIMSGEVASSLPPKFALLIAQVPVDASLASASPFEYTVTIYADFVRSWLKATGLPVVVKLHPWELVKVGYFWSERKLREQLADLTHEQLLFVRDSSTEDLIDRADTVAGISSQALVTASIRGKRVLRLSRQGAIEQKLDLPGGGLSDVAVDCGDEDRSLDQLCERYSVLIPQEVDFAAAWFDVFGLEARRLHAAGYRGGWKNSPVMRPLRAIWRATSASLKAFKAGLQG